MTGIPVKPEKDINLNSGSLIYWHKIFYLDSRYGQHIWNVTCVLKLDFANMKVFFLGIGTFGVFEISAGRKLVS